MDYTLRNLLLVLIIILVAVLNKEQVHSVEPPKKKRRIWTKPLLERRDEQGCSNNLIRELQLEDQEGYRRFLRMDTETFAALLEEIRPHVSRQDTTMRKCIPAADRLAVTLRYLATGESRHSLHFSFRIGETTIGLIIKEVCRSLALVLQDHLKMPTSANEWINVAHEFYYRWNFPLCLGALDGKHIEITPPPNSGSHFFNYKNRFSTVLLALVDANLKFLYVDIGTNGRISDGGVYGKSDLCKAISTNNFDMPNSALLPHTKTRCPFIIVADDAFPMSTRIMKPYPQKGLSNEKRIFNYRLSRARRTVENAFGVLSCRFGVFQTKIKASVEDVKAITIACCSLHNMLRSKSEKMYTPPGFLDVEVVEEGVIKIGEWHRSSTNFKALPRQGTRTSVQVMQIREEFCQYFSGPGAVPWQDKMINT